MKRNARGFTLVEILIVVIILGILAAIVIPQFTNASNSARNSSVQSTLQSVRSQLELFKIQHNDTPPNVTSLWGFLTQASDTTASTWYASTSANTPYGPYLQQIPANPLNGQTAFNSAAGASTAAGWYYSVSGGQYTLYARDSGGNTITTY